MIPFRLDDAVDLLRRTPHLLTAMLGGVKDEWARASERADTWSPFDVVGHLIHGEKTDWIPRARIILERGESIPFEPFDRFAQLSTSAGKTLDQLLKEFAAIREANLAQLTSWRLTPADFERAGTHPEFGRVTLGELIATWVTHDLSHLAQIARAMARQYHREVGPWRKYLRILKD